MSHSAPAFEELGIDAQIAQHETDLRLNSARVTAIVETVRDLKEKQGEHGEKIAKLDKDMAVEFAKTRMAYYVGSGLLAMILALADLAVRILVRH